MLKADETNIGCGAIVVGGILLIMFCGVRCFCDGPQYGSGRRDGIVQKISEKGVFWATHEGELTMRVADESGMALGGKQFAFSVVDSSVAKTISDWPANKPVRLHYTQYWWQSFRNGSTPYRVTKVESP